MAKKRVVNRFAELLAIKEREDGRRYTRRDIQDATGVSLQSIQNWFHNETTQFSARQLGIFADFLGCEPGDLITWTEGGESPEIKTLHAIPV